MPELLSKSRYLSGLRCPKLLWTLVNSPDTLPEPDPVTQYRFDQGHFVGEYAKRLFPAGIDVAHDDFTGNIDATRKLLAERKPLFEAGVRSGSISCRVDILNPVGRDEWEIVEIKSGTSVREEYIPDVAFQKFCCERAGLKIRNCKLGYINSQYVKNGDIDPQELFILEDISSQVDAASTDIEERISDLLEIISSETCPAVAIGEHCLSPYECALREECWAFLPENSIFDLRGGRTRQFLLYRLGILSIKDIPDDIPLTRQQQIQKECVVTGKVHIEKEEIRRFLNRLRYPLYYLDFETFAPAIPLYDGTRPYQNIPFEYSLHIVESEGAAPVHHSFLGDGKEDPRPRILRELHRLLGPDGSIIAYKADFEAGILKDMVEAFPEYTAWLDGILTRLVDLLAPFANFHYYNPLQKDTASLKQVLPAVTGRGYSESGIAGGMEASVAYARMVYGGASEEEIARIRADLLKYCKLDTEGMMWIVDELRRLSA